MAIGFSVAMAITGRVLGSPWHAAVPAAEEVAAGTFRFPVPATPSPNPWSALDRYQGTMTRLDFEALLDRVYDPFGAARTFTVLDDRQAVIYADEAFRLEPQYVFQFAPPTGELGEATFTNTPRRFRTPEDFRKLPKPAGKPLDGLRVAIDPGHIGGSWASMEQRSVSYRKKPPIQEGDLTLIAANLIKQRLEELGATVFMTRHSAEPVTPLRPADLYSRARELLLERARSDKERENLTIADPETGTGPMARRIRKLAELLFFRNSEIEARAAKVHREFKPDISLALHFNATNGSGRGRLVRSNRNIFFVHGAYTKEEVLSENQQVRMFEKLLEGSLPTEIEVADAVAEEFTAATGYPAVLYGDSKTTRQVLLRTKYVVARNLAANRLIDGPVVFLEPYFMNDRVTYVRLLAGDYEGELEIGGRKYRSLFREYRDAVVNGLLEIYGPGSGRPRGDPPSVIVSTPGQPNEDAAAPSEGAGPDGQANPLPVPPAS